jgi:murein DD-endopeptidase MepM/ murein hydrolase activator NlpD
MKLILENWRKFKDETLNEVESAPWWDADPHGREHAHGRHPEPYGSKAARSFTIRHPLNNPGIKSNRGFEMSRYVVGPNKGKKTHHNGIDFNVGLGTEVYAAASGIVTTAQADDTYDPENPESPNSDPSGKHIIIEHSHTDGVYTTQYIHLSKLEVGRRAWVEEGRLIGYTGMTGAANGPHLHFAMSLRKPAAGRKAGWLDPALFIRSSPKG